MIVEMVEVRVLQEAPLSTKNAGVIHNEIQGFHNSFCLDLKPVMSIMRVTLILKFHKDRSPNMAKAETSWPFQP